jgi:hypothetical protein
MVQTKKRVMERDPAIMPAYRAFIADADRALKTPTEAVIFKLAPPPGGNLHDYWSLAPYWWPNDTSPNGLPYIRKDGQRNPEAATEKYDRTRLHRMSSNALTLALAWYLTGHEEYADKGTALIWAWCCDSVTRTNPTMEFAQSRPGDSNGSPAGIIETRDLIKVVDAVRILKPSYAMTDMVTGKVVKWFNNYTHWLQNSTFGRIEAGATNNHGTWYDAQLAVFALFTGQEALARGIIAKATPYRMALQIKADGSMPAELDRTRSRHYTFFTLEAYFVLAAAGEYLGLDLWHHAGAEGPPIRKALDFAADSLLPETPWPNGSTGAYDPFEFTPLFHRAAMVYKDDRYLKTLQALPEEKLIRDRAQLFY